MSSMELKHENGCADDDRQKLKSTDPTSLQRGRPISTNQQLSKNNEIENGKIWSRVPDVCSIPRWTGRLIVGRNITLSLTLTNI
jgi:hypothetical protein